MQPNSQSIDSSKYQKLKPNQRFPIPSRKNISIKSHKLTMTVVIMEYRWWDGASGSKRIVKTNFTVESLKVVRW